MRVPKRRSDYRLGRWTAKHAVRGALEIPAIQAEIGLVLAGIGLADIDVRAAPDGAPEVFLSGLSGEGEGPARLGLSIAHAGGRAVAVVGPRSPAFGADLETIEPRSPAFLQDYLTAGEIDFVYSKRADWAGTLVWSAKEAVLKALRTGLREDTRDVEIVFEGRDLVIDSPSGEGLAFEPVRGCVAASGRSFSGVAARTEGQVLTVLGEGGIDGVVRLSGPG